MNAVSQSKRRFKPLGTVLLSMLGIVSKVISVLFKIVLIIVIGTVGIGYYQLTFPLFVFLFSISSVGISTTLTMQIAENGWGTLIQNRGFNYARKTTIIVSVISSLLLVLFSSLIARIQGNAEIRYIYYSATLAIICVSMLTLYRGVLRGNEKVRAYAISDIIEQLSKLVFAMLFAYLLVGLGELYAVIGVFVGIALSAVVALIYIRVVISKIKAQQPLNPITKEFDKRQFLKFSLIAGLTSILLPFVQFIDSIVVVRLLSVAGNSLIDATRLFGLSRGNVSALLNLPNTIIVAIEFLLLPDLLKIQDRDKLCKKCQTSITIALLLGAFMGAMFFAFSREIMSIAYGKSFSGNDADIASTLLKIGAIAVIFSSISQIQSVVLQGIKKLHLPIVSLCIASLVKITFELIFIRHIGICAAELSNVLFYISLSLTNGIFLLKNKVPFGNPYNLLFVLAIFAWVFITWVIYRYVLANVNFILAIILAVVMTTIIVVMLVAPIYIHYKKRKMYTKLS